MRVFLKMLATVFIGSSFSLAVVACDKCNNVNGNDNSNYPDNKPVIYNVSFKEILKVDFTKFQFNQSNWSFSFFKDNVINDSLLPDNFYRSNNWVSIALKDNDILMWKKISNIYGFDKQDDWRVINDKTINKKIVNVKMSIIKNFSVLYSADWQLLSFSVS